MELNEGVWGKANIFDLARRTLRFTPAGKGYRAENLELQWDAEFGKEAPEPQQSFTNFSFPFSGKTWNSVSIGINGSISFGSQTSSPVGGQRGGGVSIERFAQLQEAARTLVNTTPAICVFFKPRMSGKRYVKELADRVVISWDITEPFGNIQDFTWSPTINRFQAVLHKDGTIEMSYDQLAAKDAIIGVYPLVPGGSEKEVATLSDEEQADVPAHLDLKNVRVSIVEGVFLKITFETRGPILAETDPELPGISYRASFTTVSKSQPDAVWSIRGVSGFGRNAGRQGGRYIASGPGTSPTVKIEGNTISVQGTLPMTLTPREQVAVSIEASSPATVVNRMAPRPITFSGIRSPEVDLSSLKPADGPFALYLRILPLSFITQSTRHDMHGPKSARR